MMSITTKARAIGRMHNILRNFAARGALELASKPLYVGRATRYLVA